MEFPCTPPKYDPEIGDKHFDAIPSLDRQQASSLGRGDFVDSRSNAIFIGNRGNWQNTLGYGDWQEFCYRGHGVRFYIAAEFVASGKSKLSLKDSKKHVGLEVWFSTDH